MPCGVARVGRRFRAQPLSHPCRAPGRLLPIPVSPPRGGGREGAAAGDAEGFFRNVMDDGDRRRICGVAPMYCLLRLLAGARGEVLRYTQWADPAGNSAVTFASLAYYGT